MAQKLGIGVVGRFPFQADDPALDAAIAIRITFGIETDEQFAAVAGHVEQFAIADAVGVPRKINNLGRLTIDVEPP